MYNKNIKKYHIDIGDRIDVISAPDGILLSLSLKKIDKNLWLNDYLISSAAMHPENQNQPKLTFIRQLKQVLLKDGQSDRSIGY